MACIYTSLDYEEYKALEAAILAFKETTHKSTGGFYHKSIRLPIGDNVIEFHGPLVKAREVIGPPLVDAT